MVQGGISTDDRIFFNWLYSNYNVVSHFEVDGKLYSRQGASWPVRVIIVHGKQESNNSPVTGAIPRYDNWKDVYMTNTLKWWWPQTTEDYQSVLMVQTTESEMTPQLHSLLMESKLRRLVQEDKTPQETMMMSMEHLPEMYQIAQETEVSNYATAIMYSDSMNALMSKIIWPLETTEIQEEQQETIQGG